MRLVIDIPDWAEPCHLYVMAGIEPIAMKLAGEDFIRVKTVRCCKCGECCINLTRHWEQTDAEGTCSHLDTIGQEKECGMGAYRPFPCSIGLQEKGRYPSCTVEYKKVPI